MRAAFRRSCTRHCFGLCRQHVIRWRRLGLRRGRRWKRNCLRRRFGFNPPAGKWLRGTPLGLGAPVLAWGLGLERLIMALEGISDIRELYLSDLDWLRNHQAIV